MANVELYFFFGNGLSRVGGNENQEIKKCSPYCCHNGPISIRAVREVRDLSKHRLTYLCKDIYRWKYPCIKTSVYADMFCSTDYPCTNMQG